MNPDAENNRLKSEGQADCLIRDDEMRGIGSAPIPWEDEVLIGDENEIIGDLGNALDDPDGWMSERARYWEELSEASPPSRAAMLRHRIAQCLEQLRALAPGKCPGWPTDRISDSTWREAADELFGHKEAREENARIGDAPASDANGEGSFRESKLGMSGILAEPWQPRSAAAAQWHRTKAAPTELDWPPRPSHAVDGPR